MLHLGATLDGIALSFQRRKECLHGDRPRKGGIHVFPYKAPDSGLAFLLGLPLSVLLASAFWLYDGQAVFPANGIGNTPDIPKVCLEVAAEHFSVRAGDGVKYDVGMDMLMVCMGGNNGFKALSDQPPGKFYAELLGLFRCHFAGGIGVDDMIALNRAALLILTALGVQHIPAGGVQLTVDGGA